MAVSWIGAASWVAGAVFVLARVGGRPAARPRARPPRPSLACIATRGGKPSWSVAVSACSTRDTRAGLLRKLMLVFMPICWWKHMRRNTCIEMHMASGSGTSYSSPSNPRYAGLIGTPGCAAGWHDKEPCQGRPHFPQYEQNGGVFCPGACTSRWRSLGSLHAWRSTSVCAAEADRGSSRTHRRRGSPWLRRPPVSKPPAPLRGPPLSHTDGRGPTPEPKAHWCAGREAGLDVDFRLSMVLPKAASV